MPVSYTHLDVYKRQAYVYKQKESGQVVANCHQLPENHFLRYRLTVEEIVEDYTVLITGMAAHNPKLKLSLIHILHLNEYRWEIERTFREYAWCQFGFFQQMCIRDRGGNSLQSTGNYQPCIE